MSLTLGLDVGSKSIGWALLDEDKKEILATGVRVFPEGVNRTQQGTEESKNTGRRTARSIRRQIARRARRKKMVARILTQNNLLPASTAEKANLFLSDPYQLRKKALDEKLSAHEIGRVFLNISQRRGFKSNRKTDKLKEKENSAMLAEISNLENEITQAGCRTLGEYLAGFRENDGLAKIRGKHTRRSMLEHEFEMIWCNQAKYYPNLDESLRQKVHGAIFFQRKMYWDKKTVGKCSLEPNLPRASEKDRAVQLARLYQEINNLQIIEADGEIRPLKTTERDSLLEYLADSKERSFDDIRKKMKWVNVEFNLAVGGRDKLKGMPIDKEMESKKLFGKAWKAKSEEEKTRIVRQTILFHSRDEEPPEVEKRKETDFRNKALTDWGLPQENYENLLSFDPGIGRASFCFKALDKLLPHLRSGLPMMADDGTPSAFSEAGYQRPDQKVPNQKSTLPPVPQDITNPIVKQALNEVRTLINAIIREYGLPDNIHVELAREARGNQAQREQITINQRKNEKVREDAKARISENGLIPGRGSIEFYRLWKDQDGICIYSGKPISLKQLLGGEVNVDHIWPFSRCLDDSLSNKVVCLRDENNAKANMT
ncbi:MAG: type II CRISPR RNA-guided endonuclease Cas9, partial [Planctomycetia bacterium]